MANGYDQAKADFVEILKRIGRKYDIIQTVWSESKHFEIKFRTEVPKDNEDYNALCDEWVDVFSATTSTVWVKKISNTGPKIKFRKQYQCWTHVGKTVQKELLFDARRCRATLDMRILADNPKTRKQNKHIRHGLNVVAKINFSHLHMVDTTEKEAFFVHNCKPQSEPPKPNIQTNNDKLTQRVNDMVQKGLSTTGKPNVLTNPQILPHDCLVEDIQSNVLQPHHAGMMDGATLHDGQLEIHNLESSLQMNHLVPLQNMDSIKLEVPHQYQQITQTLAGDSNIGEQILLCQPIMLDPTQMIPVTGHLLQTHFVHLNANIHHNQQGYL